MPRPKKEDLDKRAKLEQFATQVDLLKTLNFPNVALSLGLNWFADVKPALKEEKWFYQKMCEVLEAIKYDLYDKALTPARTGKSADGSPEISYINAIVKYIDSGQLLGITGLEVGDEKPQRNPEQEAEHRRRLGLDGEGKEE